MPKKLDSSRYGSGKARARRRVFESQLAKSMMEKRQRALNEQLLMAVVKHDMGALLEAVRMGAQIDWRGHSDLTPLMWACRSGFDDIAETLMDLGADVNATDVFGRRSLDFAVGEKHYELAEKLKARGAEGGKII